MSTGKTYSTKYLLDSNNNRGAEGQVLSTTSTGIDWVDANTVPGTGLWLASGNNIYNSNSGNVGIGTTSPSRKLQVEGGDFYTNDKSDTIGASVGYGGNSFQIRNGSTSEDLNFDIFNRTTSAWGTQVIIKNTGNVGIGTTNPSSKLEIRATSATHKLVSINRPNSDTAALYIGNDSASPSNGIISSNYSDLIFGRDQSSTLTEHMRIKRDGNVGIGTTNPTESMLVISAGATGTTGGGQAGITMINKFDNPDNSWSILPVITGVANTGLSIRDNTDSADRLVIDGSGNVGIGTTTPTVRLDVRLSTTTGKVAELHNNAGYGVGFTVEGDGGVNTINSESNQALAFATNGASNERMRITSGGTLIVGATTARSSSVPTRFSVQGGMSEFETSLTNNNDWENSPVSILERDNIAGGGNGADKYSPNLNFHWSGRVSNSLWMNSSGNLNWGSYTSAGIPAADGVFNTRNLYAQTLDLSGGTGGVPLYVRSSGTVSYAQFQTSSTGNNGTSDGLTVGVNGTTAYIWQREAAGLHIGTNDTSRILINSSGNVGIGATSPTGKLEIQRSQVTTQFDRDCFLRLHPSATTNSGGYTNMIFGTSTTNNYGVAIGGRRAGAGDTSSNNNPEFSVRILNDSITGTEVLNINTTGSVKFNAYNGTNNTGSPTHILGTDANGLIVKSTAGSSIGPWLPLAGGTMTGVTQFNDHTIYSDQVYAKWGAGNDLTIGHDATNSVISNAVGNLYISNHSDDKDIIFECDNGSGSSVSYLTLDGSTTHAYFSNPGNVGIGVTSPDSALHVSSSVANTYSATINSSGTSENMVGIRNTISSNVNDMVGIYFATGATNAGTHWSGITGSRTNHGVDWGTQLNFYTHDDDTANLTEATQKMVIKGSGNVGIGTTSPGQKLEVAGTARFRESFGIEIASPGAGPIITFGSTSDYDAFGSIGHQASQYQFVTQSRPFNFINGSTSRMFINNSGNVGIGTTSPSSLLHLSSSSGSPQGITVTGGDETFLKLLNSSTKSWGLITTNLAAGDFGIYQSNLAGGDPFTAGTAKLYFDGTGNVGIGTTSPTAKLQLAVNNANDDTFQIFNGSIRTHLLASESTNGVIYMRSSANSNTVRINASGNSYFNGGNVGIGTTSPGAKLDVDGAINTSGSINLTNAGVNTIAASNPSNGYLRFLVDQQGVALTLNADKTSTFGGEIYTVDGNKAAPGYSFTSDPDTGMFRDSANVLVLGVNGDTRIRMSNTNVVTYKPLGVNTTSITSGITLEVAGNTLLKNSNGVGDLYLGNYATANHFRFHTNNANTYFDMNCGDIYWRQGTSTRYQFFASTANMTIQGTLTQNSDARTKENVVEISDCISKVKAMRGVYYNRTDFNTDVTKVGVIAQEVEAVLPELVLESPETGLKSVAYSELTSVLINAIKEQQEIIEDLKSRITKLEN